VSAKVDPPCVVYLRRIGVRGRTPVTGDSRPEVTPGRPIRPDPQPTDRIFTPAALDRLHTNFRVVELDTSVEEEQRLGRVS
jgi:hypothetical protein